MKIFMHDIIVCYLCTKFDDLDSFDYFIKNYKKYDSGLKHKLLICYKMLNAKSIYLRENKLNAIKHIQYLDPSSQNDFDFGSYYRVCKKFPKHKIFFLTGSDYPIKKFWLKNIVKHYDVNSLIGTSASYQSLLSSLKLKKFYKIIDFLINYFKLKKNFPVFPNPHIRSTGFLIFAKNYIQFYKNKSCKSKFDAWKLESGKDSLTNFFISKKYMVYVVNSDGNKFNINQWHLSKTFNYAEQDKFIISDKHTRKYLNLKNNEKKKFQLSTWGINN